MLPFSQIMPIPYHEALLHALHHDACIPPATKDRCHTQKTPASEGKPSRSRRSTMTPFPALHTPLTT
ncbi:hypothetical protein B0T16DRAFT_402592 [Cercophora newfieldiana]|uniref:Uncharacterized protein n=1 Tax=Cercophora newfieldiana TaxID=92897 RepID=A0AA39YUG6_9PEZI|nr:hypothetical protein B0T16DRAFT_402592 [Cercophora newfieldiana]